MGNVLNSLRDLDSKWNGETASSSGRGNKLRKGTYLGVITDWKIEAIGEKQTPALKLEIEITARQERPSHFTDEGVGSTITNTMFLTEKTLQYVARDLKSIGKEIKKASEIADLKFAGVNVKIGVDYGKEKDKKTVKEWPDVVWMDKGENPPATLVRAEPVPESASPSGSGKPPIHEDDIPF